MARYLHYSWLSGRCMNRNGDCLKMHRHIASRLLKALYFFLIVGLALALAAPMVAQRVTGAEQQSGSIAATVVDPNDETVAGATVVLQGPASGDRYTTVSNDAGFFAFHDVKPGTPYRVTVRASGFAAWTSPSVEIGPSEYKLITGCKLRLADVETSVNVGYSSVEVATEQVAMQEKQRVLGVVPNFYVNYDPNPEPLTPGLKFQLAMKVASDPVTALGVGLIAGIRQAANSPDFQQGAKGYGQRYGVTAANGLTSIVIGGAILPSLLHQDPRYFYQGEGTKKSRILHALSYPFICPGDSGRMQPNYSSLGGDLASAALSNAYYPQSNRGASLVLGNFAIGVAEHMAGALAQEFLLHRFTKTPR